MFFKRLILFSYISLQVIKFLVLPRIKQESEFIRAALEGGNNNTEKKAAEHLQELLLKHCMPVILKIYANNNTGVVEDQSHFVNEYGSLFGNLIFQKVKQSKANNPNNTQMSNHETIVTPTM